MPAGQVTRLPLARDPSPFPLPGWHLAAPEHARWPHCPRQSTRRVGLASEKTDPLLASHLASGSPRPGHPHDALRHPKALFSPSARLSAIATHGSQTFILDSPSVSPARRRPGKMRAPEPMPPSTRAPSCLPWSREMSHRKQPLNLFLDNLSLIDNAH